VDPYNVDGAAPEERPRCRYMRADMFAFLRSVALAADLDAATLRTLMLVAVTGDGTSGANVSVDAATIAAQRGVTERTVWRHLKRLRGTWLEQTTAPTRGDRDRPGRRARYHLCIPEPSDTSTLPAVTRFAESSDTPPRADVPRFPESSDIAPPEMSDENENHLTSGAESSDIAERENVSVLHLTVLHNPLPPTTHRPPATGHRRTPRRAPPPSAPIWPPAAPSPWPTPARWRHDVP
jgi:hypothetical protein